MKTSFKIVNFLIILISIQQISCKKTVDPVDRKVANDVRDSVYYYSESFYLWYKNLPKAEVFKPLGYSSPEAVIEAVRSFSDKNPNGTFQDRFSFVIPKKEWNNIASGKSSDFGVFYRFAANGNYYVRQVFANSSAGIQGVERGWRILSVEGMTPQNNDVFLNKFSEILTKNTSFNIKFEKPDGTIKDLVLKDGAYQTNTLQQQKIFVEGDKKIGYFMLTDFLGDDTAQKLNTIFTDFKSKGINELIVDFRYNGGGYVYLAEQLSNLIAPTAANGKVMFTYEYNDKLTQYNKSTKFKITNDLGLKKVVFIVTRGSASASELVINALKPFLDVKLVGSTTNGKPVGFPVIPVYDFVVAPVAFKTVNADGKADYYEGFKPDFPEVDDITRNFGDPNELCLKVALDYVKTGKVTTSAAKNARIAAEKLIDNSNDKLPKGFEGMYDDRLPKSMFKKQF